MALETELEKQLMELDPSHTITSSRTSKKSKKRRKQKEKSETKVVKAGKTKKTNNHSTHKHDTAPKNENKLVSDDEYSSGDDDVELVQEKIQLEKWDPNYDTFSRIFEKFYVPDAVLNSKNKDRNKSSFHMYDTEMSNTEPSNNFSSEIYKPSDPMVEEKPTKLSNKKFKEKHRITVAQLKQCVQYPDIVELNDANSKEPKLLVYLKSYRNTVPVPAHWSHKRKYLQGKRGFVKPPFELPDFIKATGIMEMRSAYQDKEDSSSLKVQMRNKIRPKLGRVDVDYQKLHDAFFKFQTKPPMTKHGDMYYEGKEFEGKLREKKPGDLSDELRLALGMPVGMNKQLVPPPWLIAMQRYGPPPSYPNLKIAGLNAPLPEGAFFGYHIGGWGKPPVDESGRPLYGDVFAAEPIPNPHIYHDYNVDKSLWGEIESDDSQDESDDREEDMAEVAMDTDNANETGLVTPSGYTSGMTSIGFETPDEFEVRKLKESADSTSSAALTNSLIKQSLYSILPQKKAPALHNFLVQSGVMYDMKNTNNNEEMMAEEIENSANDPNLLQEPEIEPEGIETHDGSITESSLSGQISDMNVESSKKKVRKSADTSKSNKKYKDFKF